MKHWPVLKPKLWKGLDGWWHMYWFTKDRRIHRGRFTSFLGALRWLSDFYKWGIIALP